MDLIELIKSVNIVEYISQYVDLKQKGEEWWALSPFKAEKTPSFSVREDPPQFFDYSSGIGGNLYTFIRYYHKVSPREAVEILKEYAGVTGEMAAPREKMAATLTCKKFAAKSFPKKESKGVVLQPNHMDRYEYREDKLAVWEAEGISKESMRKFGVLYDSFSNRLVYTVKNIRGDIVNVGGRTLDQDWKEKGQRKYNYFYQWGTLDTIYGVSDNMESIKQAGEIILFEGCKSVLIADSWGIHNCGAILTSHLNPNQMKILAKLGCRVVFALDKDVRIRDDHNIEKLRSYVNVEYIWDKADLLDDKDSPVDKGEEVFRRLYAERIRYR